MKKCKRCGAPLEGFLYKTLGKLMGIKPSVSDPDMCNKCEEACAEQSEKQPSAPVPPSFASSFANASEDKKASEDKPSVPASAPEVPEVVVPAPPSAQTEHEHEEHKEGMEG